MNKLVVENIGENCVFQVQNLLMFWDSFILPRRTSSVMRQSSRFTPRGCVIFFSSVECKVLCTELRRIKEAIWIRMRLVKSLIAMKEFTLLVTCTISCYNEEICIQRMRKIMHLTGVSKFSIIERNYLETWVSFWLRKHNFHQYIKVTMGCKIIVCWAEKMRHLEVNKSPCVMTKWHEGQFPRF